MGKIGRISYCTLTCQCGHEADLDEFCRTPVSGELPKGHYQCPGCGYAWQRKESEHKIITNGFESMMIPGKVELLPVSARL